MSSDLNRIERSVRWAYERGRLRRASIGALLLLVASTAWLLLVERSSAFYFVALGLSVLAGVYLWRGGDSGNALLPGLAAGLVPLLLSSVLLDCGRECSGACLRHCMAVCAVGASAAGLLAGVMMRHHPRRHRAWLFAVALVPASGLLGCPHIGYGQLGGLLLGLVVSEVFLLLTRFGTSWTRRE